MNSICIPTQIPRNGRPEATASCAGPSRPAARSDAMHAPNAPTPGRTTPSASAINPAIGGQAGIGTFVLECLLRGVQVADAVVEHGDQRSCHRTPLVDGTPPASSTRTASRSVPCEPLERRFDDVVHVAATHQLDVQRDVRPRSRTTRPRARRVAGRRRGHRAAGSRASGRAIRPTDARTGRARRRRAPRRAGTDRWRSAGRRPCRRVPPRTPRRRRWRRPRPCGACRCAGRRRPAPGGRSPP